MLRRMRGSPQEPRRKAREGQEEKIAEWKALQWPQRKARAVKEHRTVVFVDESGLTQKPASKSTWAPEGETPVRELNFNGKKLSVIGGMTIQSNDFVDSILADTADNHLTLHLDAVSWTGDAEFRGVEHTGLYENRSRRHSESHRGHPGGWNAVGLRRQWQWPVRRRDDAVAHQPGAGGHDGSWHDVTLVIAEPSRSSPCASILARQGRSACRGVAAQGRHRNGAEVVASA